VRGLDQLTLRLRLGLHVENRVEQVLGQAADEAEPECPFHDL
jgi:hypothetical protein